MARPLVQIDGAARLRRTMRRAGVDMTVLKDANKEAADTAATASRPLVPQRTGRLLATIRTAGTTRAGIIRAGRKRVPYAGPIHWGWPARHIEAQPFLTDGAQRSENVWVAQYLERVDDVLRQVEGI
ncbi:HK97 gp10 family phage protein [Nocardia cyriacigeorgica]|uniref:HK97 gp10 family phage protein n=1 Tax=Nocardia cyriacigeorgica TaxID=135487 RepID=UPI00189447DF|nr:HK97 gp10 family phage protein [Nocardia cyriacigeorgica]MBF6085298.1 HK97 gp10 family phage protein [Nocardia cyriacigeorgica]